LVRTPIKIIESKRDVVQTFYMKFAKKTMNKIMKKIMTSTFGRLSNNNLVLAATRRSYADEATRRQS